MQASRRNPQATLSHWLVLLAILLGGLALRLYRIDFQSLWWDEAHSLHVASQPLASLWDLPRSISFEHPPLYFLLLKGWIELVGHSEFGLRLLSALLGMLIVPVAYRASRLFAQRGSALAAAGVCMTAPVLIAYSQEVRSYGYLAVVYLLLVYVAERIIRAGKPGPLRLWVALTGLEVIGFYSNYFMVMGLIAINLLLAYAAWHKQISTRRWLASQIGALALALPWIINLGVSIPQFAANVGGTALHADPLRLIADAGLFLVGGNPAVGGERQDLQAAIGVLYLLAALAWALLARRGKPDRAAGRLLLYGLLPAAMLVILFRFWPRAQPRYFISLVGPILGGMALIGARAVRLVPLKAVRDSLRRAIGFSLLGVLIIAVAAALFAYFGDPATFKDDARGVGAYLEQVASRGDAIFVSSDDYSIQYYYTGPAFLTTSISENEALKAAQLVEGSAGAGQVFVVRWYQETTDKHGLRPFLLELNGRYEGATEFKGYTVEAYALEEPLTGLPSLEPVRGGQAGPLALIGAFHEAAATNDSAAAVMLRWKLADPTGANYAVSVRLVDESGLILTQDDNLLYDERNHPTSEWAAGEEQHSFHVLPIPVGALPAAYRLVVIAYTDAGGPAGEIEIGQVKVEAGSRVADDPYRTRAGWEWATPSAPVDVNGLRLERIAVRPVMGLPGQPVDVLLHWTVTAAGSVTDLLTLALAGAGQTWAQAEGPTHLSTQGWPVGASIIEQRTLLYPAQRGSLDLLLKTDSGTAIIGNIELDEAALLWQLPETVADRADADLGGVARLAGFAIETRHIRSGEPFEVTLYWQAPPDAPLDRTYTAFVQLLAADGHLIAQHDGPPGEGMRPLMTWIGGEIIPDLHLLAFTDPAYKGPAMLIVGFYDPLTVARLTTADGADHIALPAQITVK